MQTKDGVKLDKLQFVMRPVLVEAEEIWQENGRELVITSTTESVHSAGSYHYYGLAVDLRTNYFDEVTKQKVYKKLQEKLEGRFRVVLEKTHIHVQFIVPTQPGNQ